MSYVAPVQLPDGTAAVLKVNFPDAELETEADALVHWDGVGSVRLLADDAGRCALLVERCEPGTPLWTLDDEDEAMRIAAGVLRRLWRPAPVEHRFRLLRDRARGWAEEIPAAWKTLGRPFERRIVHALVAFVRERASEGDAVVLHRDFHSGNILRAGREPWLAIDPYPLVGERAFDAASLLRDRTGDLLRDPARQALMRRRLDLLVDELGVDREATRGWGIVHALAWGVSAAAQKVQAEMVACARLLMTA
jgi:streptomycin 6-kinase